MLFTSNTFDTSKFLRLPTMKNCFKLVQKYLPSRTKNGHTCPNRHKIKHLFTCSLTYIFYFHCIITSLYRQFCHCFDTKDSPLFSPQISIGIAPSIHPLWSPCAPGAPPSTHALWSSRRCWMKRGTRWSSMASNILRENTERHVSMILLTIVIEIAKIWHFDSNINKDES